MTHIGRVFALGFIFAAAGFAAATTAAAQNSKFLGSFDDWEAYAGSEGKAKVCYAVSKPTKEEGKYSQRGEVYLFVTERPGDKEKDVVNVKAGYTYKPKSTVRAEVGNRSFELYVKDDTAWNRTAQDDRNMVQDMVKGASMVVKGTSEHGTATTDTFSLKGFTAAYKAIGKACGGK